MPEDEKRSEEEQRKDDVLHLLRRGRTEEAVELLKKKTGARSRKTRKLLEKFALKREVSGKGALIVIGVCIAVIVVILLTLLLL